MRKFNRWYYSNELIASGSMPVEVRNKVVTFIAQKKNGIIEGGTGSGKTTLMKAFLDHIPLHERLCIIEQPAELKVLHPNAVRWEAVEAIPGQVAITPSEQDKQFKEYRAQNRTGAVPAALRVKKPIHRAEREGHSHPCRSWRKVALFSARCVCG